MELRYFGLEGLLLKGGKQMTETRVRVNAGGTLFETTRATLTGFCTEIDLELSILSTGQPDSHLAKLLVQGEQELFLDVCPKVG